MSAWSRKISRSSAVLAASCACRTAWTGAGSGFVEVVALKRSGAASSVKLLGTEDISVEIFWGNAKKDLFEKAFGVAVAFEV